MRAHVLQHIAFEGPGSIRGWLDQQGAVIGTTRFYLGEKLPDVQSIDLLVIMGGPMSVNDESINPWLAAEKQFIREAISSGIAVLGVCLGAQLIASALGSRVYANSRSEIGWFPVYAVRNDMDVFRFPAERAVFHWHGETFNLPPGAVRLAANAVCENQAFQFGRNVIGLQFHLESTPESVVSMVENCRHELQPGEYIQSEETLLSAPADQYDSVNQLMDELLSYLVAGGLSSH